MFGLSKQERFNKRFHKAAKEVIPKNADELPFFKQLDIIDDFIEAVEGKRPKEKETTPGSGLFSSYLRSLLFKEK